MPRTEKYSGKIENEIFTGWDNPSQDGLTCDGKIFINIKNCLFHRKEQDPTQADELLSVINGAQVTVTNSTFAYSGKGVLVGTGDSNEADYEAEQAAHFEECMFVGLSRRSVMVNAGVVTMHRCLIKDWGLEGYFHHKSYGTRAKGEYAIINLTDCIYEQEGFLTCIKRGTFWLDLLRGGGFWLTAFAEDNGKVFQNNCHKNRRWLKGVKGDMDSKKAEELKAHLEQVCPKLP